MKAATARGSRLVGAPRAAALLLAAAVAAVAYACSEGETPTDLPTPGVIAVVITPSQPGLGAVVVRVDGPVAGDVSAASPALTLYRVETSAGLRAFVAGMPSGSGSQVIRFRSPDTRQLASYAVTVEQAAGTDYAILPAQSVRASLEVVQ